MVHSWVCSAESQRNWDSKSDVNEIRFSYALETLERSWKLVHRESQYKKIVVRPKVFVVSVIFWWKPFSGESEEESDEEEITEEDMRLYREYMERLAYEEAMQQQAEAEAAARLQQQSRLQQIAESSDDEEQSHFTNADGYQEEQYSRRYSE